MELGSSTLNVHCKKNDFFILCGYVKFQRRVGIANYLTYFLNNICFSKHLNSVTLDNSTCLSFFDSSPSKLKKKGKTRKRTA